SHVGGSARTHVGRQQRKGHRNRFERQHASRRPDASRQVAGVVTHVSTHIYHQITSAHLPRDFGYLRLIRDEPSATDLPRKVGASKLKLSAFREIGYATLQ